MLAAALPAADALLTMPSWYEELRAGLEVIKGLLDVNLKFT
jgi:hypothetical protein